MKPSPSSYRKGLLVAMLILLAILCRQVGRIYNGASITYLTSYLRSAIYIGLFTWWGVSVRQRIIQVQIRRYLMAVAGLMVLWMVFRTIKFNFEADPVVIRQLWYWYYWGMLFIPLLTLLTALSLGKPEDYRLPAWTVVFFIPTAALLLLVLTNDLHQLVFVFPKDAVVWLDDEYSYGPGYWFVFGWVIVCALAGLVVMLLRCRVPRSRKVLWLPFVPTLVAAVYGALYVAGIPLLFVVAGDLTAFVCLFFTAALESCIQCGLIQSNTHYTELFQVCGIHARITDGDYQVCLSSEGAQDIPAQTLRRAASAPVMLEGDLQLSGAAIRGGCVLWTQDVSEEACLLRELQAVGKQLEGENDLLLAENELKEKQSRIHAQNHLYDRITRKIEPQLNELGNLVVSAKAGEADTAQCLARIAVLGAYIKRRSNLVLLSENSATISTQELGYCLRESGDNFEAAGISCSCVVNCSGSLETQKALALYDLFEAVTEAALPGLTSALIRITTTGNRTELRLLLACDLGEKAVQALPQYQDLENLGGCCTLTQEDGGLRFTAAFQKGDDHT